MKRLAISLIAVAASCIGTVAVAEDKPGIPDEIIAELDGLVGTWAVDGNVGDKKQTGDFICRWAQNRQNRRCCIIGDFSYTIGDQLSSGVTLIGWNATEGCIEDRGFDAQGGNGRLLWTVKSPTHWTGVITIVRSGEEVEAEAHLIKKEDGSIVYEAEGDDGKVARHVFTKVKKERKQRTE